MKMWLDLKVLHSDQLVLIQEKVDSVDAASNIGAIPRKIHPRLEDLPLSNGKIGPFFSRFLH